MSQTHVGDHTHQPFECPLAKIIIRRREKKVLSLYDAKIRCIMLHRDFTCLVFRGSRCRFVRCVGGSIGCFIVVRLYSRRYCRVGVRNARQISRVGRRVAFGETWWLLFRSYNTRNLKIKIIFLETLFNPSKLKLGLLDPFNYKSLCQECQII